MIDAQTMIQKERYGLILRSISRYKRITRTELARILRLSSSALVKYIKTLIDAGIITETDRETCDGGGRRSVFLEFNPRGGKVIAIAIYQTYIEAGVLAINGDLVSDRIYSLPALPEKDDLIARLFGIVDDLMQDAGTPGGGSVLAIGIAMGGHLDIANLVSCDFMFARHWRDVPLGRLFAERFGLPFFLVKDTNACALGEQYYGNGIGVDNFLSVWMGDGLGLGIVIDGKNYTGASGYAGELGHTHGTGGDTLCYCGHTGCLETTVSQDYILSTCRAGMEKQVQSLLRYYCGDDISRLAIGDVIRAANEGDRFSMTVLSDVGEDVGRALSDLANVFNPELISLRGPVIDGNRFLYERIRGVVVDRSLREISTGLSIKYSSVDDHIHLKGVCGLIVNGLIP